MFLSSSDDLSPTGGRGYCVAARNDSSVWFVFLPVAPLSSAAAVIPGLAAVTITLALLSSVLLFHLLCFHIYLSKTRSPFTRSQLQKLRPEQQSKTTVCLVWNRLSTYEYIVRQRHRHGRRDSRKTAAAVPSVSLFNVIYILPVDTAKLPPNRSLIWLPE